jgi:hypothetical protein
LESYSTPEQHIQVIPKIRRVPHTIVTSPEELIYRQKQFEAAVKANPQAGATASERRGVFSP